MKQGSVKEEIMKREREGQVQQHAIPSATNASLACLLKYPSEQWNWKRMNTIILRCGNVCVATIYSPLSSTILASNCNYLYIILMRLL
jgi:hypothetical protein